MCWRVSPPVVSLPPPALLRLGVGWGLGDAANQAPVLTVDSLQLKDSYLSAALIIVSGGVFLGGWKQGKEQEEALSCSQIFQK